jgi:hypothetical protein
MPKPAKSAATAAPPAEYAASPAEPDDNPMAATPDQIARSASFEALYGRWLLARAKCNAPGPETESDAFMNALNEAELAALRELVTTQAPSEGAVWFKIEALDFELDREAQSGHRLALRTNIILAAIKADLANLDFGGF